MTLLKKILFSFKDMSTTKSSQKSKTAVLDVTEEKTHISTAPELKSQIEAMAEKFNGVHKRLRLLISAMKAQQASLRDANQKRLETMQQFELFAHNTPLGIVTAGTGVSGDDAPGFSPKTKRATIEEDTEAVEGESPTGGVVDAKGIVDETERGISMAAAEADDPECKVTARDVDLEDAATSGTYVAIHLCVNDISKSHLNEYYKSMIQYAEEWDAIVSNRINAGLYEYKKLCDDLHHYTAKVNKLRAVKIQSKRREEKLFRNEQKLLGAQEAYRAFGENLYMYIEEVTDRAWKDLYPLLLNAVEFDLNYCAGEFKFLSHLAQSVEMLKQIGGHYGLHTKGRLPELDADPMQSLYTGPGHGVKRASSSTRSHHTDSAVGSEPEDHVHEWAHSPSTSKSTPALNPAA